MNEPFRRLCVVGGRDDNDDDKQYWPYPNLLYNQPLIYYLSECARQARNIARRLTSGDQILVHLLRIQRDCEGKDFPFPHSFSLIRSGQLGDSLYLSLSLSISSFLSFIERVWDRVCCEYV